MFAPDAKPSTCSAATRNKAASTIRPIKALRLSTKTRLTTAIKIIAAASTSDVMKFNSEKKPLTVSERMMNARMSTRRPMSTPARRTTNCRIAVRAETAPRAAELRAAASPIQRMRNVLQTQSSNAKVAAV